jgi:hypothetical protein
LELTCHHMQQLEFSYIYLIIVTLSHSRIVFDDTEDIFADKITQQALLALNEATAAIMVRTVSCIILPCSALPYSTLLCLILI